MAEIKIAENTFDGGLNLDLNPLFVPKNVLSDCLNGTFVTGNGQDMTLQNDMGNSSIAIPEDVNKKIPFKEKRKIQLKEGYVPVGSTSFGGILYIASLNPMTNDCEIGTFPSPDYNRESTKTFSGINNSETFLKELISGDIKKFTIFDENEEQVVVFLGDYISNMTILEDPTINKLLEYGYITPTFYAGNIPLIKEDDKYILKENTCGELSVSLEWTPKYIYNFHYDTANNHLYLKFIKFENELFNSNKSSSMIFVNYDDKENKYIVYDKCDTVNLTQKIIIQFSDGTKYEYNTNDVLNIDIKEFELTKYNRNITKEFRYKYNNGKFSDVKWILVAIDPVTNDVTNKITDVSSLAIKELGFYKLDLNSTQQNYIRPACETTLYNSWYEKYEGLDFINLNLKRDFTLNYYVSEDLTKFNNLYTYPVNPTSDELLDQKIDVEKTYNIFCSIDSNLNKEQTPFDDEYYSAKTLTYTIPCTKYLKTDVNLSEYFLYSMFDLYGTGEKQIKYHKSYEAHNPGSDDHKITASVIEDDFPYSRTFTDILNNKLIITTRTNTELNELEITIKNKNSKIKEFNLTITNKNNLTFDKFYKNIRYENYYGSIDADGNIIKKINYIDDTNTNTDCIIFEITDSNNYEYIEVKNEYIEGKNYNFKFPRLILYKYYILIDSNNNLTVYESHTDYSKIVNYRSGWTKINSDNFESNKNYNLYAFEKNYKNVTIKYNVKEPVIFSMYHLNDTGNTNHVKYYSKIVSESQSNDNPKLNYLFDENWLMNQQFVKINPRYLNGAIHLDEERFTTDFLLTTGADLYYCIAPMSGEIINHVKNTFFYSLEKSVKSLATFEGLLSLTIGAGLAILSHGVLAPYLVSLGVAAEGSLGLTIAMAMGSAALASATIDIIKGNSINFLSLCIAAGIAGLTAGLFPGLEFDSIKTVIGVGEFDVMEKASSELIREAITTTMMKGTIPVFAKYLAEGIQNSIKLHNNKVSDGGTYLNNCGAFIWKKNVEGDFYPCIFNQSILNVPLAPYNNPVNQDRMFKELMQRLYIPLKSSEFNKITEYINKIDLILDDIKLNIEDLWKIQLTGIQDLNSKYMQYNRFKEFHLLNLNNIDFSNNKCYISLELNEILKDKFESFKLNLQSEIDDKIKEFISLLESEIAVLLKTEDNDYIFNDADGNIFAYESVYVNSGEIDEETDSIKNNELHYSNKFIYLNFNGMASCIPNEDSFGIYDKTYCVGGKFKGLIFDNKLAMIIPTTYHYNLNKKITVNKSDTGDTIMNKLNELTANLKPEDIEIIDVLAVNQLY